MVKNGVCKMHVDETLGWSHSQYWGTNCLYASIWEPVTVHNIEIICMYISEGRSIYFRVCTCNKYYYKMGKIVIDLMLKNWLIKLIIVVIIKSSL